MSFSTLGLNVTYPDTGTGGWNEREVTAPDVHAKFEPPSSSTGGVLWMVQVAGR